MNFQALKTQETYDGSQLAPRFIYMRTGVSGDAGVWWVGPCQVSPHLMKDAEDLRAGEAIKSDQMLHFLLELFDLSLIAGVGAQRLFADHARQIISSKSGISEIRREGDDLYLGEGKLSISIATKTNTSVLIHFAINVTNAGTPVKTASLEDLKLAAHQIAEPILNAFKSEWQSMKNASWKAF